MKTAMASAACLLERSDRDKPRRGRLASAQMYAYMYKNNFRVGQAPT